MSSILTDSIMKKLSFLFIFILSTIISKKTNAQAGTLDTTFSNDGIVTTNFGSISDYGTAIAIQSDGRIVVAGQGLISANNHQFILSRYLTDGSMDTTFGFNGKVFTNFGNSFDGANGVIVQTDGKIVAAGYVNAGGYKFATSRYNIDGSLDTTFNLTGMVITNAGGIGQALTQQTDGKIIIAGGTFDFDLVRYNLDGSLDTTFDFDGMVATNFTGGGDWAYTVALQTDRKIVAGGTTINSITGHDFALARYDTSGALDFTFDFDGKKILDIDENSQEDEARAMAIQTDGKILLAGYFTNTANKDFAIVRVNNNGSIDSSFSSNGIATFDILNTDNYLTSMTLQSDGKILLSGINFLGVSDNIVLMRLDSNGNIDNTFGSNGIVITTINNIYDESYAMTLQNDGKILLAGTAQFGSDVDVAVLRYNNDIQTGIIDFSVTDSPVLIYPNPVKDAITIQYTLNENEKLTISLLDINGRILQTFFKDQSQQKGTHQEQMHFDKIISSGAYLLSISNSQGIKGATIKIILE